MNWKIFLTVCISLVVTLLPSNIIGCGGGDADPYDYFVSFFDKKLDSDPLSKPFYYTNYKFLYDDAEPVNLAELTSSEWISYTAVKATRAEAFSFVCRYAVKDITNLYNHIEKSQPLTIPDSLRSNPITGYFIDTKDLEALGYIIYAKKLEPHVTGSWSSWEPIRRDSIIMGKLIKNGQQLYHAAKKSSIKLRYAYQVVRLAHYSKRYQECLDLYETLVKPIKDESVLQELCISLQAGALQHLGKREEAAYEFSKLFNRDNYNRISNYMSFDWSVDRFDESNRKQCLQLCKTDKEKAGMLALFALGSNQDELEALQKIYELDPASPLLATLTIREIHKIEDYYFTPSLAFQLGDTTAIRGYEQISKNDPAYLRYSNEATGFVKLCERIAAEKKSPNGDLYLLSAAHTAMIARDFKKSGLILKSINVKKAKPELADQVQMTNILLTVNAKDSIDGKFEEQLLPSVKWLIGKAKKDAEYEKFYRRLFVDVLASKYKSMKGTNHVKYLLCLGVADKIVNESKNEWWGYSPSALFLLREKSSASEITKLIELVESSKLNSLERFLVTTSAFTKNDLNDIAGTASLREYDFIAAEKWLSKVPESYYEAEPFTTYLAANPFADLMLDTHQPTEADSVTYTRLSFSKKMNRLKREAETAANATARSKTYYELAKGYYHMSYWGNSWLLGRYSWSGSEYEYGDKSRNQDYFNVDTAKAYYLKAYNASADNNFKAKALFMAAKCDQKLFGNLPGQYNDPSSSDYQKDLTAWLTKFDKRNKYFSTLGKTYRTTAFFKEAQRTCSYLDDFVKKMKR